MKSECESVKAENAALKATQEPLLELQELKKVRANASNNAGSILCATKTLKGNRCNENENLGNVLGKAGDVLGVTITE